MPNESNKCNGIVTSKLMGIAIVEYAHADGRICARPGPSDLAVGSLIESQWMMDGPLCEHTITCVHSIENESEEEKPLTVSDILGARPTVPNDGPVDQATIERAKVPPPIRHGSYVPIRTADVPIENLDQLAETKQAEIAKKLNAALTEVARDTVELRELNSIRGISDEPSAGPPVSPFSDEFNPRTAGPRRKSGKPVSPFDWK